MDADRDRLAAADRISADWLSLRERADAAAREPTREAVQTLLEQLAPRRIVDVGCGTGAGGRWLLPQLPGGEHWVLLDHDSELLATTARRLRDRGAQGQVEIRCGDVAALEEVLAAEDEPTLVIASALLDLLTAEQVEGLVSAAARHAAPMLLALTVTGGMACTPQHSDDELVAAAFDRHQQRGGRCGPQAPQVLLEAAAAHRLAARDLDTPWTLGPDDDTLLDQLIRDRADVAAEQLSAEQSAAGQNTAAHSSAGQADAESGDGGDLLDRVRRWRELRLAQLQSGELRLRIGHVDVVVGRAGREPATGGPSIGSSSIRPRPS